MPVYSLLIKSAFRIPLKDSVGAKATDAYRVKLAVAAFI